MSEAQPQIALSSARGRGVLFAAVVGSGIAFLDTTVVNVALPTLGRELHVGMAGLQWTVDAFLLTLGALLLVGGALGDRYGRRRVFVIGLIWFTLASACCGFAPNVGLLIAARMLQGVGGALLVPGSLALMRAVYREADQGRAIGLWSGLAGVTTALGPVLGGWLIGAWSWRLAFFINVPLGALGVWAALHFVPESRDETATAAPDLWGALLATVGLAGLVYALIEGPARGWQVLAIVSGGVGTAAFLAFFALEARSRAPMLPLGIFRSLQFTGANLTTLAVYFALSGALFLAVIELQRVLGYSPLEAGAAMTPITVLMLLLSPVAGRATLKVGHRGPMTLGPLIAGAGLLLLSRVEAGSGYLSTVLPGVGVLGLGLSITVAPLTDAVFQGAPQRHAGVASGVNNAVARIAGLLAVALLPWAGGIADTDAVSKEAFTVGFHRGMWLSALACVLGAAVAFLTIERRGPAGH